MTNQTIPADALDNMGLTLLAVAKIVHHDKGHPLTTWPPEGCAACLATAARIRALAAAKPRMEAFAELD